MVSISPSMKFDFLIVECMIVLFLLLKPRKMLWIKGDLIFHIFEKIGLKIMEW